MERYQKIYTNPLYNKLLKSINEAEKERIFCLHGWEHAVDTARIAYILSLEEGKKINKDILYATALLHDIGRHDKSGEEHDIAGAKIAAKIMSECGYSEEEVKIATEAILTHRNGSDSEMGDLLYRADKLSRLCFDCKAQSECYWENERRNNVLKY